MQVQMELHGHLHRVTYTRGRIDTIDSPDDKHLVARNMQRTVINKYKKKNLRQVGCLQGLETKHFTLKIAGTGK